MKSPQCLLGLLRGGYRCLLKEESLVELLWSPPPHGGDRRALGLHIGLCGCLQGKIGKLALGFVMSTLFPTQEPYVRASGDFAGSLLVLHSQARCVDGGCGRDIGHSGIPSWDVGADVSFEAFQEQEGHGIPRGVSGTSNLQGSLRRPWS